jgi:hypothetical protein
MSERKETDFVLDILEARARVLPKEKGRVLCGRLSPVTRSEYPVCIHWLSLF